MKRLIILFVLFGFVAQSQTIEIPKDTVLVPVGKIVRNLDTFNIRKLGNVVLDTVINESYTYPTFADMQKVDSVWESIAYKKDTVIGSFTYSPIRRPLFKLLASGRMIVAQEAIKKKKEIRDKPIDKQIYIMLDSAYHRGVSPEQLLNYGPFDTLLHWNEYHAPPIDTTSQDSIL